MLSSVVLSAVRAQLQTAFADLDACACSSPRCLLFRGLTLRQRACIDGGALRGTLDGRVAELRVSVSVPMSPLAWAETSVSVEVTGLALSLLVEDAPLAERAEADLQRVVAQALARVLGADVSTATAADAWLLWLASRVRLVVRGAALQVRVCVGAERARSQVRLASLLVERQGDGPALQWRVSARGLTVGAIDPLDPLDRSFEETPSSLLLNPVNATLALTLAFADPPSSSSSARRALRVEASLVLDRIELTCLEAALPRLGACVEAVARALRLRERLLARRAWRRALFRRAALRLCHARGLAKGARPSAADRWACLRACMLTAPPHPSALVAALRARLARLLRGEGGSLETGLGADQTRAAARDLFAELLDQGAAPHSLRAALRAPGLGIGVGAGVGAGLGLLLSVGLGSGAQLCGALVRCARGHGPYRVDCSLSCSVSRVALSLYAPQRTAPLLHAVCYGAQALGTRAGRCSEGALRVGRVRCFGALGEPVFECGRAGRDEEDEGSGDDSLADLALQSQTRLEPGLAFLELSVSPLRLYWSERAHVDLHRTFRGTFLCAPSLRAADGPGVWALLGRCAEVAVSVDVRVQQLFVDVPFRQFHMCAQRDASLRLSCGPLVARSGRFLEDQRPASALQTLSFSLADAQLSIEGTRAVRQLVAPWGARGAASVRYSPAVVTVALALSEVRVLASDAQLLSVLDVCEQLLLRWQGTRAAAAPPSPPAAVPLPLPFSVEVELTVLALRATVAPHVVPLQRARHSVLSLLAAFERVVARRGVHSHCSCAHRAILRQRLAALGVGESSVALALELLLEQADAGFTGEDAARRVVDALALGDAAEAATLVTLSVSRLGVSLRLGRVARVFAQEVSLLDADLLPILAVRGGAEDSVSVALTLGATSTAPDLAIKLADTELRLASDFHEFADSLHRALVPALVKGLLLGELLRGAAPEPTSAGTEGAPTLTISVAQLRLDCVHREQLFAALQLSAVEARSEGARLELSASDPVLLDLTEMGGLHSVALWGASNGQLRLELDRAAGALLVRLVGVRVCCLDRFAQELGVFLDHAVLLSRDSLESMWRDAAVAVAVPLASREGRSSDGSGSDSSDEEDRLYASHLALAETLLVPPAPAPLCAELRVRVQLEDAVFFVPRNSTSRDALALAVGAASYETSAAEASWPTPALFEQQLVYAHRHFDAALNQWRFQSEEGSSSSQRGAAGPAGPFHRALFQVSGCAVFACLSAALAGQSAAVPVSSEESVVFAEVRDGEPVFIVASLETGARARSTELWRAVSSTFNMQLVWDASPECSRILLTDTVQYSCLTLDLSMAEYYLLLSLYYDNCYEAEQFFRRSVFERADPPAAGFEGEYGTRAYFAYIRSQVPDFELVFTREMLVLHCSFDSAGYFAADPASQATASVGGGSDPRLSALAAIHLERGALHYKSNASATQASFNCGAAKIEDETHPRTAVRPVVLELEPHGLQGLCPYGFSSFDYELTGAFGLQSREGLPLTVSSFYNCATRFRTTIVKLIEPELCLSNLHLMWMLVDYFTLYYSSPAYGNPYSVDPRAAFGFGSDLRLWFQKPVVLSLRNPSSEDSQYLMLDSSSFVAYRLMCDSSGASKATVEGSHVALVLVKQLRETNRGLRGAAGSGRGIRTVVERLHFRVLQHVLRDPKTLDLAVDLTNVGETETTTFDWDCVSVPQSTVMESTCVENVDVVARVVPPDTLNLVCSFEDSAICLSVLSGFLAPGEPSRPDDPWGVFCALKLASLRVVIVDNVVGLHLPLFQILVEELSITLDATSFLPESKQSEHSKYHLFVGLRGFADYFNYACKCWEPLVEPVICEAVFEQGERHRGLSLRSKSNMHVNSSGACLKAVHEMVRVVGEDLNTSVISGYGSSLNLDSEHPVKSKRSSSISLGFTPLLSAGAEREILHLPSQCLNDSMKVGFSILNATGQSLRYLVDHGEARKVVRYLRDGQRGILNFPATLFLIRNNSVYEEAFDVQRESESADRYDRLRRMRVGHLIGLQISGFRWIETEADVVGARYEKLSEKVVEGVTPSGAYEKEWKLVNALMLLAEVTTTAGGRLLRLRSVFEIRNRTHHRVHVLLSMGLDAREDPVNTPFTIEAGGNLYVPLALLHGSMHKSAGRELGFVRVRPAELSTVKVETEVKSNVSIKNINYSADPIRLTTLVENSFELLQAAASGSGKYAEENLQLVCHINSELKESRQAKTTTRLKPDSARASAAKIPPFIYNVEVTRQGDGHAQILHVDAEKTFADVFFKSYIRSNAEDELKQDPLHYLLVLQPPIVLQNLLPAIGKFTIVNTATKTVLWTRFLACGESVDIHTLSLEEPLTLLINLGYCRSTEGARIHVPLNHKENGIASIQRTIEGFLEEDVRDKTLWLTDFVGQRLKLQIENEVGGGGQRFIKVFTLYWLINTSQYLLRFREELSDHYPAGTVTASKDGTKSVPGGDEDEFRRANVKTIFPGKPGPLTHVSDLQEDNSYCDLLGELSAEATLQLAYMFNFNQNQRRMMVQLDDSNWSRPFSLDSVGVNQELSIEQEHRGNLEVGFRIDLAPGVYGKYTRVVRFSPRFVVVNCLPHTVYMCQPTGVVGEFDASFSVLAEHRKPFHLPCVFGKRKLAVQLEGLWSRSVLFSVDMTGEFTMLVRKELSLASIEHIVTRPARFNVWLPSQELGVWFETDWKQQEIVVKSIRAGLYASNFTEIQAGDVLLSVNGIKAEGKNFDTIMHLLKKSNRGPDGVSSGQYAEFMSSEEKLASIRRDAFHKKAADKSEALITGSSASEVREGEEELAIRIDVHIKSATMFIVLKPVEAGTPAEYMIVNCSPSHSVMYKQKGIRGNRWLEVAPGESCGYFWEHPLLKQRVLLVQLGRNELMEHDAGVASKIALSAKDAPSDSKKSRQFLTKMEKACVSILLDDIGEVSSTHTNDPILGKLVFRIFIRGATKVLEVCPEPTSIPNVLKYSENMIAEQQRVLRNFKQSLSNSVVNAAGVNFEHRVAHSLKMMHDSLRTFQKKCFDDDGCSEDDASAASLQHQLSHISVFGTAITKRGQILIRVLEAKELKRLLMQGAYTYCTVNLKTEADLLFRDHTYRTDDTTNPLWVNQVFLINVPETAATSQSRAFVLSVVVYSTSLVGVDRFLGRVDIPLGALKSQEPMEGWFSLRPKTSSIKYSTNTLKVSGSLKLGVQWVYSSDGLVHSLRNSTQTRLCVMDRLEEVSAGMRRTLATEEFNQRRGVLNSSYGFESDLADTMLSYVTDGSSYLKKKLEHWVTATRGRFDGSVFDRSDVPLARGRLAPRMALNTSLSEMPPSPRRNVSKDREFSTRRRMPSIVVLEKRNRLRKDSELFPPFTMPRVSALERIPEVVEYQRSFAERFDEESRRNQLLVNASVGRLTFKIIEAQNLPACKYPLMVRVGYGDLSRVTHSVLSHGSEAYWDRRDSPSDPKSGAAAVDAFAVEVDTLNIRGLFRVSVLADTFPSISEVASLELPFFSILSTIALYEESSYERWFPLCLSNQSIPIEGETGTMSHYLQKESQGSADFGLKPCIRLALSWTRDKAPDSAASEGDGNKSAYAIFSLPACSLAIINSEQSQEVLEISMQNLDVRYSESTAATEASVNLVWLQVDNQLPQSAAPVILCPTFKINAQPILRFILRKNNLLSQSNLTSYENVELIVQELDIFLEQKQVVASWNLLQSWMADIEQELENVSSLNRPLPPSEEQGPSAAPRQQRTPSRESYLSRVSPLQRAGSVGRRPEEGYESKKIYIENFVIGPIKMNVSFIISPDVHFRQARVGVVKGVLSGDVNNLWYAFAFLARQIGNVVLDLTSAVTDAPIELNCLQARHLFKTDSELTKTLQDHYLTSFLKQLYKIVGSLDLVGNPIGIVSSLGVGVRDFFFEPTHALITNPTEIRKIGRGVVKGTLSLVSNVSEGTIGTLSTITRAAGRGVARLSGGDSSFLKRREELMKRPKSLLGALTRPLRDIENGLFGGLIGIVKVPYNGAKRSGMYGFAAGVPIALVGLVAKPIVGVLDAVSHMTESLGDGVQVLAKETQPPLRRRRLSNLFGPDGRVMAYSRTNALGTYILQVSESSRWRLSLSAKTSSWISKLLSRDQTSEEAKTLTQKQYLNMSHVLSTRLNPIRSAGFKAGLIRESDSLARAEMLSKALEETRAGDKPDQLDVHPFHEFVVYTAILHKIPGSDIVVILSTDRVVVASYKRFSTISHIKIVWQCLMSSCRVPLLDSTGTSTILTLRAKTEDDRSVQTTKSSSEFEIKREYNDYELINVYNVLNALLGNFDYFLPNVATGPQMQNVDVCYDSAQGIMRIGPWEYAKEIDLFDDENANDYTPLGALRDVLEASSWTEHDSAEDTSDAPRWLRDVRKSSVTRHDVVEEEQEAGSGPLFERGLNSLFSAEEFMEGVRRSSAGRPPTMRLGAVRRRSLSSGGDISPPASHKRVSFRSESSEASPVAGELAALLTPSDAAPASDDDCEVDDDAVDPLTEAAEPESEQEASEDEVESRADLEARLARLEHMLSRLVEQRGRELDA